MGTKTVLISGGTSGIGLATAQVLLDRGVNVAITGRSRERGQAAMLHLKNTENALYIDGDVSVDADCAAMVHAAITHFGHLDGLVTSAGQYEERLLENVSYKDIQRLFAVNVYGTINLCRHSLPYLKQTHGAIVTVSSDAGIQGNVACSIYGATKGAVVAFTKSLALETAPHGVRVNTICPGDVQTPMLERQMTADKELTAETIKQHYPLYRICTAQEVAKAIVFLLSDDASYITAAALPVDGGLTSW